MNKFKDARNLAEKCRFKGDTLKINDSDLQFTQESINSILTQSGLPITKELTPNLSKILDEVCQRLKLPLNSVSAYVYASPELQAQCYSTNLEDCVISLSSSIVDILKLEEIAFVIGHEIGHFLLGHGISKINYNEQSLELLMQQRAQEISVDRIAYLATESLDYSMKALIKTISGLSDENLRFDISNYISHLRNSNNQVINKNQLLTHPPILFRCRALLWYSMNVSTTKGALAMSIKDKEKLDERILRDLKKYVDGPARKLIEEAKSNLAMWTFCKRVVQDSTFDKKEQEMFAKEFGEKKLKKLKNLLKSVTVEEARQIVSDKQDEAKKRLKKLSPVSYDEELVRINKRYKN